MNFSPSAIRNGLPEKIPSWPILGSVDGLRDPFRYLSEQYQQFGPVFRMNTLGETRYVLAGPEACRFMSESDPQIWNRSRLFGKVIKAMGLDSLVVAADGQRYTRLRNSMRIALSRQASIPFIGAFIDQSRKSQQSFRTGAAVMPVMKQLAFDQMRYFSNHDVAPVSYRDCDSAVSMMLFAFLNSRLRCLFYAPKYARAAYRSFKYARQAVVNSANSKGRTHADMLELLTLHRGDDSSGLSDMELSGAVFFACASGMAYSSRIHAFLLYHLLKDRELYTQVQFEIDPVFKVERPSPCDLRSMRLLRACILETMRLYPVQTVQPYQLDKTIVFEGYKIPKGTKVYFYPYASHFDPMVFRDPERFDPTRFLAPRNEHKQKFAFNAFGVRPRNCAGSGLVEILAQCTIGPLLYHNDFSLVDPNYVLTIKADPIGAPCGKFKVIASPRSQPKETVPVQKILGRFTGDDQILARDLEPHQLDALQLASGKTKIRRYSSQEVVVRQGDPANEFFMVLDGDVDVLQTNKNVTQKLSKLGKGEYFGEIGILQSCPRTATVRCGRGGAKLGVISKDVFLSLVESSNLIGEEISKLLQERHLSNQIANALPGIQSCQIKEVLDQSKLIVVEPGQDVFVQGDLPDCAYIIARGELAVLSLRPDGSNEKIAALGPGQFFGETGVVENQPRNATIRVEGNIAAELISIGKQAFQSIANGDDVGQRIHEIMSVRLEKLASSFEIESE